jgi:hypothetical protein
MADIFGSVGNSIGNFMNSMNVMGPGQGDVTRSQSFQRPTEVWGGQAPYLQGLYAQGQGLANAGVPQGAMNVYNQQAAGGVGVQPWLQSYRNQGPGADVTSWMNSFRNPGIDPAFNAYSQAIGQQFREQVMPEMQGQAALAGGLGNSRAQIGQALAGQRAMQEIGNFGANAYAGQQQRSLAAGTALGGFQNDYAQRGMQAALGLGQLQDAAGNRQMLAAQALQAAPWYNMQQYKGLLGNPAIVGGGGQSSSYGQQGLSSQFNQLSSGVNQFYTGGPQGYGL